MKLHDVRKRYPCGVCDKAYDRKFQLVHHLRLHTSDTPFECEVCFLAFSDEQQLSEHGRVHTSDKPFECRYCLKGFPQKKALIVHLRMHTGERPFPCQFCERTFTQKAHLQGHMVRIHIPKKKVEYHKINDMQPATQKSVLSIFPQMKPSDRLSNNSEIRINPVMTEADIAAFTVNTFVNVNCRLTGQREKLIGCDFCDKKFTYERNKTNHMKKHSGEAQYECETCQRNFPTRNNLASHLLTHVSSGSPFRCDICGREFNMKRNLIMHVKSHNNERPFECPACEKSFKLKYFLELHLTRIHPHIRFEDLPKKVPENVAQMQKTAVSAMIAPITPNKRKQSQPKKVVKVDYESDSNDMSYGEYSSESENDMKYDGSVNATKFVEVYLQEPKNLNSKKDDAMEPKSLQINLPHDLRHVKKMLNVKAAISPAVTEMKNISCPLCPVMVSSKAVLAIHMKEHDKNKPHQCTMCDKVYIQQASFEKHMRKHMLDGTAGNHTSAVEQDSYRLNYFPQLKAEAEGYSDAGLHVKGDGRKPLECKICRKKYAQPASFEKHMRQHSELEEAKSETMVFTDNVFEKLQNLRGLKYSESAPENEQSNEAPAPEGGYINPSDFLEVSMDHS
ncbi:uncharacterized protein LOC143909303 isoform X2 [Arctopsyche grandis]